MENTLTHTKWNCNFFGPPEPAFERTDQGARDFQWKISGVVVTPTGPLKSKVCQLLTTGKPKQTPTFPVVRSKSSDQRVLK